VGNHGLRPTKDIHREVNADVSYLSASHADDPARKGGGKATVREIATGILIHDESQIKYYEAITIVAEAINWVTYIAGSDLTAAQLFRF
jgi:hypothetical protein